VRRANRNKIDLSDSHVAKHWIKKFGKSKKEIEAALRKVGDNPQTLKKELGIRPAKSRSPLSSKRNNKGERL
jgi:ribosome biogenesis GTPase A